MTLVNTDILIVGAGPVGLASALLLEKQGLNSLIVERREGLHIAPQAHVISSRSMEICRALGIDDKVIRAGGTNPADTLSIRWVDHLLGRDLGVYSLTGDPESIARMFAQTPTPICNLSQDRFEQLLYQRLSPETPVMFEHTWMSFEESADGYLSRIESSDGTAIDVASRYIIGADGAGSRVRSAIGATMNGPHHIQNFVNVHFSANLRSQLQGREGLLYWVMDEACQGTFIAHDIDSNWIFMKTAAADENLDEIDEAKYERLLRDAIGVESGSEVELDIHSMSSWVMTAQVASAYRRDRVFLVGDAAHRFPPTGGIGMNTGLQDAHNLAWKIGMVERGFQPDLLDSYEPERKPVAEANSAQSHHNAVSMSEVSKALDVDGDGRISNGDLDSVLSQPGRQAAVQTAIDRQAEHFNMSGLDLGFCYQSNAVISDGRPPQSDKPVSNYLPSTTPGARLPHAWLSRDGEQISTLDLVPGDAFLLLSFNNRISGFSSVTESLLALGYPLECICVHEDAPVKPADPGFDGLFAADEVLLVRPDGHIGARLGADRATERLAEIIGRLLPGTLP